jgi:hypothetical protein
MAAVIDRAVVVPSRNLHRDVAEKLMKIWSKLLLKDPFGKPSTRERLFEGEGQSETTSDVLLPAVLHRRRQLNCRSRRTSRDVTVDRAEFANRYITS